MSRSKLRSECRLHRSMLGGRGGGGGGGGLFAELSQHVSPDSGFAKLIEMLKQGKTPDDIKQVALPALRHRLILRPEAEIEGLDADAVIKRILAGIEVPR